MFRSLAARGAIALAIVAVLVPVGAVGATVHDTEPDETSPGTSASPTSAHAESSPDDTAASSSPANSA